MLMIKIMGKVAALPLIVLLGTFLTIARVFDKLSGLVVGLLNLGIGLAIIYCLATKDWHMVQQGVIFFIGENVLYLIAGLIVGGAGNLKDRLMGFVIGT